MLKYKNHLVRQATRFSEHPFQEGGEEGESVWYTSWHFEEGKFVTAVSNDHAHH